MLVRCNLSWASIGDIFCQCSVVLAFYYSFNADLISGIYRITSRFVICTSFFSKVKKGVLVSQEEMTIIFEMALSVTV